MVVISKIVLLVTFINHISLCNRMISQCIVHGGVYVNLCHGMSVVWHM